MYASAFLLCRSGDVIEEHEQYLGQVITVRGTVEEVVGPRSFTMSNETTSGEALLVVGTEDIEIPAGAEREETYLENSVVQVTGTVYMFDDDMLDDAGDAYGFMYEDDAFNQHFGEPVIIVDDVVFPASTP